MLTKKKKKTRVAMPCSGLQAKFTLLISESPPERHPCVRMKVAKLELKLVLAFMILGYDYSIVDKMGTRVSALPQLDLGN